MQPARERMIMSDWLKAAGLALALALSLTGCEQGEGDVCQVDEDCEIGLSCNATTGLCQPTGGPAIDASPTPDAAPTTPDASADASVDASVDASP